MRLDMRITKDEVARVRAFYRKWARHPLVATRRRRNVLRDRPSVSRGLFWEAMISALLTTQQRSGPKSSVGRLIQQRPFPLSLGRCRRARSPKVHIRSALRGFGGVRRSTTIATEAAQNLAWLESGGWNELFAVIGPLEVRGSRRRERVAARFLAEHLKGIGPKQSRNTLQMLGLTRFETPIDSRITKWLNEFGFPIPLSAAALADPGYYEFVADTFQGLCKAAGVVPCLMDAAIFVSFDNVPAAEYDLRW